MTSPVAHTFDNRGLNLHFIEWGDPDAPPIVMLHGGLDHKRSWDALALPLSSHYRVIVPDLRGHGDSDWLVGSGYMLADFIDDLHRLLRMVAKQSVSLVGHSFGAHLAMAYSALFPPDVTRLVAIEPLVRYRPEERTAPLVDQMRRQLYLLQTINNRNPRRFPNIQAAIDRMGAAYPGLAPELIYHLVRHGIRFHDDGSCSWKYDPAFRARSPQLLDGPERESLWPLLSCPVLWIQGADSDHAAADTTAARDLIDTLDVCTVQRGGHWIHHDQPGPTLKAITDFLADCQ